ncbi:hypothetical protein [Marinilabilia sp.]|uniref:hypothetical protein n=1 Tax=Marinilabilia sp. TaxID=2021252 RepID=UPI0025C08DC6|nr:hypothetical protein [Marinilabilia sp.]
METLIALSNFLIAGLIIIAPVLIFIILKKLKTKRPLIIYSLIGLFVLGVLMWIFAWWSYESDLILLKHYGYNLDGMSETEFFGNVLPENMDKVKRLETSIMGIGWPVKAILGFVMTIPYLIFVYIGKVLIDRILLNKNDA